MQTPLELTIWLQSYDKCNSQNNIKQYLKNNICDIRLIPLDHVTYVIYNNSKESDKLGAHIELTWALIEFRLSYVLLETCLQVNIYIYIIYYVIIFSEFTITPSWVRITINQIANLQCHTRLKYNIKQKYNLTFLFLITVKMILTRRTKVQMQQTMQYWKDYGIIRDGNI